MANEDKPATKANILTKLNTDSLASTQLVNAIEAKDEKGFWRNVTSHRRAVAWSLLLSTAVIMEGFDILLIQNLQAVDSFQRTFGQQLPDGSYELTAGWQAGLTNGAIVGEMIGLAMNGILADRYGFKKTMIGGLVAITGFIFIPFFATSIMQLLVGLILMGIPWGIFQTLTTTYAAEVCPTNLRPYLTTYVNLCWVIGQFLASAVLVGTQSRADEWAYRTPYALQWMWPVPLVIGIALAPESPWWLVRKGKMEEAAHVLNRLANPGTPISDIDKALSQIKVTDDFEKSINEGTSYIDCFKGVDLRRTEIVCITWLVQSAAGSTFFGYSTYFYQAAGLESGDAFSLSLGQYAIGGVGTILSWGLMGYFGRRTLHISGLSIMFLLMMTIGCCGLAPASNNDARWAVGSLLVVFIFFYQSTVGPITYCLVAEIPSTRLRQKSVALARNFFNISSIVCNILTTQQLNPSAWNWGARAGFFWAGSIAICSIWVFFRLPEPKGRSYAELDVLFERRVNARKFASVSSQELADAALAHGNELREAEEREYLEKVREETSCAMRTDVHVWQ